MWKNKQTKFERPKISGKFSRKKYQKEWSKLNGKEYSRRYALLVSRRLSIYKYSANKRKIKWFLSDKEFKSFLGKNCYLCGHSLDTIGIDRINNQKGYIMSNCRPCCQKCNNMKYKFSMKEFLAQCRKIINYHNEKQK